MKYAMLLLFVVSAASAEPVEIEVDPLGSGKLVCRIDQRVNGRIIVRIEEEGGFGCRPIGLGRFFARRSYISSIVSALSSTIGKANGFRCEIDSSYQLHESCELNTFLGYRSTSLSGYATCVNERPAKDSICVAFSACRANVVRVLSDEGVSEANTSFSKDTLKNEDVLLKFDEFAKSKGCNL